MEWFVEISTLIFLIVFGAPAHADTAFVDIEPGAFNPDNVTINVNDKVVWTWVSDSTTIKANRAMGFGGS